MNRCLFSFSLSLFFLCACAGNKPPAALILYVNHDFPPFVIHQQQTETSLSDLLAQELSKHTGQPFTVQVVRREVINQRLRQGEALLVLWGNENWYSGFSPVSSMPIIWDSDVLITGSRNPVTKYSEQLFMGSRFCAISGYQYPHLQPALEQADIVWAETNDVCLKLLHANKIDYLQIERSHLYNYAFASELKTVKVLEPSVNTFTRSLLMFNGAEQYKPLINQGLKNLNASKKWTTELQRIGDQRFINLFDMDINMLQSLEIMR
ncbi:MAG: hypothetical protein HRU20_07290 [Pseudomonadales bacterium]|nr:hypothetical protein [Pseudomonadales bacterium]